MVSLAPLFLIVLRLVELYKSNIKVFRLHCHEFASVFVIAVKITKMLLPSIAYTIIETYFFSFVSLNYKYVDLKF